MESGDKGSVGSSADGLIRELDPFGGHGSCVRRERFERIHLDVLAAPDVGGLVEQTGVHRQSFVVEVSQRHTERDLTYGGIVEEVSLLRADTNITTFHVKARARPRNGLHAMGEYRFRTAQDTGLLIEPDEAHRFNGEVGYDFSTSNVYGGVSFHFQENHESNDTHVFTSVVAGVSTESFPQDFENDNHYYDATVWVAPAGTPLTFTASFNRFEDKSQQNLFRTNQGCFRSGTTAGVVFTLVELTSYENITNNASLGVNYQVNDSWAVHSNFTLSESEGGFTGGGTVTSALKPFSRVSNELQTARVGLTYFAGGDFSVRFEFGHDNYDDRVAQAFSGDLNTINFAIRKSF